MFSTRCYFCLGLDGNLVGINLCCGSEATIENSLITDSRFAGLVLTDIALPNGMPSENTTARVVNSTFSNDQTIGGVEIVNWGTVHFENSTIIAPNAYLDFLIFTIGNFVCYDTGNATSVNTVMKGVCNVGMALPDQSPSAAPLRSPAP